LLYAFPFEKNEVIQSCEEVISSYDADEFMEQPSDIVDEHIDDFIQVGRRRWDVGCFIVDRDPIYEIEGSSQAEGAEIPSSKDLPPCMYDLDVWQPSDDMVIDLLCPFSIVGKPPTDYTRVLKCRQS
jgi:hypothetical protein